MLIMILLFSTLHAAQQHVQVVARRHDQTILTAGCHIFQNPQLWSLDTPIGHKRFNGRAMIRPDGINTFADRIQ